MHSYVESDESDARDHGGDAREEATVTKARKTMRAMKAMRATTIAATADDAPVMKARKAMRAMTKKFGGERLLSNFVFDLACRRSFSCLLAQSLEHFARPWHALVLGNITR